MATDDDEGFKSHAEFVLEHYDGVWPDDPPELDDDEGKGEGKGEVLAAWSYATGWANALDMTVKNLLDESGIAWKDADED